MFTLAKGKAFTIEHKTILYFIRDVLSRVHSSSIPSMAIDEQHAYRAGLVDATSCCTCLSPKSLRKGRSVISLIILTTPPLLPIITDASSVPMATTLERQIDPNLSSMRLEIALEIPSASALLTCF